jgi:hypothetical protein
MKKFLFFIGLFAIAFLLENKIYSFDTCPECDFSNSILSIKPEDVRYLLYLYYQNVFEKANVRCSIGEFRIVDSSGTVKRLYWELDATLATAANFVRRRPGGLGLLSLLGQAQNGEDQILTSAAKTESFVYTPHSTLKFFRELSLGVPCGTTPRNLPEDANALRCDELPFWLGIDSAILNRNEWVIQLISESTGSVLAVLDSVGFVPNGSNDWGIPYGTNPLRMNHTRQLPDEYAGESVYIRVSVRQFGPTSCGMLFDVETSRINYSAYREYGICCDKYGVIGQSCKFSLQKLDYYYYQKVVEYLDSIVAANNRPPKSWELPPMYFFDRDSSYGARILDRYFERDSTGRGWVIWDNEEPLGKKPIYGTPLESQSSRKALLNVGTFVSKSGNELTLTLKFNSNYSVGSATIEIFDFRGNRVITSKGCFIPKGYSESTLHLPGDLLAKGIYLLVIKNIYGIVFSDKFIIW